MAYRDGNAAVWALFDLLENAENGTRTLEFKNSTRGYEKYYEIKAATLSEKHKLDIIEAMKAAMEMGNDEGYEYQFVENVDTSTINLPNCKCGGMEVSDTFTIRENKMNSDCDTYATIAGEKAEALYFFWETAVQSISAVRVSYWCL